MTMIQVEHLCKRFGNVEVLSDISMEVKEKSLRLSAHPDGKSTLLRCINQFETVTKGKINICGDDMIVGESFKGPVYAPKKILKKIRLNVGVVFQQFHLFPHFMHCGI